MTNINTQLGISCLTAVVSSVQSKNIDLFLRQRIALGQLVLTCLPSYLVLVEVVPDELVQVRLLVIRLMVYRIELQYPVVVVSLQRALADAQQLAYLLIVVQAFPVQVVQMFLPRFCLVQLPGDAVQLAHDALHPRFKFHFVHQHKPSSLNCAEHVVALAVR